ncbi:MAG: tetratricopeptide repeat protein [Gemmataceae bacterium]
MRLSSREGGRRGLNAFGLLVAALILLPLVGWAGLFGARQIWASYHFRAARAALEEYHLADAHRHLKQCLEVWPDDPSARLLAVRAARLAEDYDDAERHLREVQRVQGVSDTTSLEWAMLQAHYGDLDSVEVYLRSLLAEGHPTSFYILDALTAGYVRMYRNADALAGIKIWLDQQPDCIQALSYRGRINQRLHAYQNAAADFRKVVEADPSRDNVRLRLVACLLEFNQTNEALQHAQELYKNKPDDPEVIVVLANCFYSLGQFDEGAGLLDKLLEKDPNYAPALIGRGQIALQTQKSDDALKYLRKAVDLSPIDVRANHELYRCLEQLGMVKEAEQQHQKLLQLQKNVERLIEISNRDMARSPNDPALHTELGNLMITLAQENLGERWLLSALQKDPNYGPAHQSLADFYEKKGDHSKARQHRERAQKDSSHKS